MSIQRTDQVVVVVCICVNFAPSGETWTPYEDSWRNERKYRWQKQQKQQKQRRPNRLMLVLPVRVSKDFEANSSGFLVSNEWVEKRLLVASCASKLVRLLFLFLLQNVRCIACAKSGHQIWRPSDNLVLSHSFSHESMVSSSVTRQWSPY